MELLICSLISVALGVIPVIMGILPAVSGVAFSLMPIAFAFVIGEFLLPKLIHLSPELYDLHSRVSDALPTVYYGQDELPENWNIYVALDDAKVITAVGSHTLIVTKGCYNMRPEEFHFALQEAVEQRRNKRSIALLIATVGNPIFLVCRIFCRVGRLITRILFFPLTLIASLIVSDSNSFGESFRRGARAGSVVAAISDKVYYALSVLFIKISNLSLLIYSPVLGKMDAVIDQQLLNLNLRRVMVSVINENARAVYTGDIPRENCIIYRTAPQKRIEQLDSLQPTRQTNQQRQSAPSQQQMQSTQTPRIRTNVQGRQARSNTTRESNGTVRPRHTMRILPSDEQDVGIQTQGTNAGTNNNTQDENRPRHRMRIIP